MYSVNISGFFKIIMSDEGVLKLRRLSSAPSQNLLFSQNSSNISTEIPKPNELNTPEEI